MKENYLISGAGGFIGKHLLAYNEEHAIIPKKNVYLLSSKEIEGYKTILHKNYQLDKKDFSKIPALNTFIHLASFSPKVRSEMNNIQENIKTIVSLGQILEHLPNVPQKIVYISTISVYGEKLINYPYLIDEKTPPSPDFLYGHAKLMSEEILKEYCTKHSIELYILRIGVSYGPNDDLRQGTIPTIVKKILNDEELVLYNNGNDHKHFIHTKDISRIILDAGCRKCFPGQQHIVNIVDSKFVSVIDLVRIVEKKYNKSAKIVFAERLPMNDSLFDNRVMINLFGNLEITLQEGLEEVCSYYKNNRGYYE